MNEYTIVDPTNLKPRVFRSRDSASETGVVTGIDARVASRGKVAAGPGTIVAR